MLLESIWTSLRPLLMYDAQRPLMFHHAEFFLLISVALGGAALIGRRELVRLWLTLFSFFVYYRIAGAFAILLGISIVVDYGLARLLAAESREPRRRALLTLSIVVNLGLLGWFKYSGLLAETLAGIYGGEWSFRAWALPAGISFYTFQSLSYTIDVYRREIVAMTSFRDYAFFVSLFPQLVAGPIVRASHLIPQIDTAEFPDARGASAAMALFAAGAFKKALIADPIATRLVDPVFTEPLRYTGAEVLLAIYGYGVQIYADFSGYSDMAIALAALLGFQLPVNFSRPYMSTSITDFWRRWHISLSTWLRDYLYIPLGGSRRGRWRTYVNLMLVMLLGGMWHGAAWRFGLWGAWHGGLLALERATGWAERVERSRGLRIAGIIVTFHLVCLGWVFFRADSLQTGVDLLRHIITSPVLAELSGALQVHAIAAALIAFMLVLHATPPAWRNIGAVVMQRGTPLLQAAVLVALVWAAATVQISSAQPFIYFQF